MAFVPEGQLDSSQARNAWSHEENSSVPAGRLNGYRLALKASEQEYLAFLSGMSSVSTTNISGTDNDFDDVSESSNRSGSSTVKLTFMELSL
jgi:hypothetical protein